MKIIRNPELRGILTMIVVVLVLGTVLAGMSGKLDQWGITWFSGAKAVDKIIFVSNRAGANDIYIMNLDGSDQKPLTKGARVLSAPTISPAGNKIAFVGMNGNVSQVLSIGVVGGNPQPITASPGTKRQPEYSPDGKKLSYIEAGRVFVSELNGSNPDSALPTHAETHAAMTDTLGRGSIPLYQSYAWGPGGGSMAGVTNADKVRDVLAYLPKLEGDAKKFTASNTEVVKIYGMAWASEKPLLVISMAIGKENMLVAFDPEQKSPRPIIGLRDQVPGSPTLSPDGSIVIVPIKPSGAKSVGGLLKIDLSSGKAGMLCRGEFEKPVFSPKGDGLIAAKMNEESGERSIVKIDPAGGEVKELATNGDNFNAIWSPTSSKE